MRHIYFENIRLTLLFRVFLIISIKKSNHQTLFRYSEKQNNWQTIIGQKFRLTPATFPVGFPTSAGTAITHFLRCST